MFFVTRDMFLTTFSTMFSTLLFTPYAMLIRTCNYKKLGIAYVVVSAYISIAGVLFSLIIRNEISNSDSMVVSIHNVNYYYISITAHGVLMIFFVIMSSMFAGIGNMYIVVNMGASEVPYPRVNNISVNV